MDSGADALCGELRSDRGTRLRGLFVGAGILCAGCGHPWSLLQMIYPDGSRLWTGYCADPHADACRCSHNQTQRTLRELGVPFEHRLIIWLSYYVLRQWRG